MIRMIIKCRAVATSKLAAHHKQALLLLLICLSNSRPSLFPRPSDCALARFLLLGLLTRCEVTTPRPWPLRNATTGRDGARRVPGAGPPARDRWIAGPVQSVGPPRGVTYYLVPSFCPWHPKGRGRKSKGKESKGREAREGRSCDSYKKSLEKISRLCCFLLEPVHRSTRGLTTLNR